MNHWTQLSIEYANQRNYLDDLFHVYPTIPEGIREIDAKVWTQVEAAFSKKDNKDLINSLLNLKLFPIKNSYVAYLKRDRSSIDRNPKTVDRLCGQLYEMGLDEIYERSSQPKENNRQLGPLFRRWLNSKALGIDPIPFDEFIKTGDDAILDASDAELMKFAKENLNYKGTKGLDLVARFNGKYVVGEAKFLTDFGGHQNAQYNDAMALFSQDDLEAVPVAILDGVLYIPSRSKMYRYTTERYAEENILSALLLREFLYGI